MSLTLGLSVFAFSVLVIALAGMAMVVVAERLAERTMLGQALVGGVLLGASTSLSGIVASVAAAYSGHHELALSNAIGGIAVQTAFLVVADGVYRRANLEHAAASLTNMSQSALLIGLLTIPLFALTGPSIDVMGVHPATAIIIAAYGYGLKLSSDIHRKPMWQPRQTVETQPKETRRRGVTRPPIAMLFLRFAALAILVGGAGYLLAESGVAISRHTGVSQTVVGAFLTATSTSLPELVTTVAAVRRGALTLAVGGIIGGNTFDVLLIAFSDVAYRAGSIYAHIQDRHVLMIAMSILMTACLLLGLLRRETYGVANIGFESLLVLIIYLIGTALQLQLG